MEQLRKRLNDACEELGFEVEGEGGKIEILFEEPEGTRFVVSPNAPARQIWISALSTSFKLGWSEGAEEFKLERSGENLEQLMTRIIGQQLGREIRI